MRILTLLASAFVASPLVLGSAQAQSLAGSEGTKRYPTSFPQNPKDPCRLAYKAYVAASGHSAYAQTLSGRSASREAFFCGISRNAPSKKAAEQRALADCKRTGEKYKVKTAGACQVYASK